MSVFKLFVIICGTVLFLFGTATPVFAQDEEPDFSFLDDPNTAKSTKSVSETEAGPPCTTCGTSTKTKNQQDLENVAKTGIKQNSKKKKQVDCITCGKDDSKDYPITKDASWSQFPQIAAYSNSPQVAKMIEYAKKNKMSSSHGRCFRWVKGALCGVDKATLAKRVTPRCQPSSLVSSYPPGARVSTKNSSAINTLKGYGFKNLMDDPVTKSLIKNPASAPKGAILIYKGGNNGGHIEIKTGSGNSPDYISDFSAPDSIFRNDLAGRASRHYELIGVMVKETI